MRIAIIGTGNVAYHLAKRLAQIGCPPQTVASRTLEKGQNLIRSLDLTSQVVYNADLRSAKLDFVIIAVPDQEIKNVVETYSFDPESILLHASGAQSMDIMQGKTANYGVLYPFQTFSRQRSVDFNVIPIFIEGNSPVSEEKIMKLAQLFGPQVRKVSSQQRLKVHLAAVFASNFSNYMFHAAENILKDSGIMLSDLEHLMKETVEKAVELTPRKAQTGPAIRDDQEVLNKHMALLENAEELKELYQLVSNQIAKMRND